MVMIRAANLLLSFLLELGMLAAFSYWGYHAPSSPLVSILAGVALPVVAAVIWGIVLAPKARFTLTRQWHRFLELVLFGLATVAVYAAGRPELAIGFGALVAVNQLVTYRLN